MNVVNRDNFKRETSTYSNERIFKGNLNYAPTFLKTNATVKSKKIFSV